MTINIAASATTPPFSSATLDSSKVELLVKNLYYANKRKGMIEIADDW